MMHLLARQTGLIETIDSTVEVLKKHLPYHESDHVLNIVYDALSGGTCLGDIELRRQDEVYLDARPAGSRSDDRGRLLPAVRKRRRRAVEASITETLKRV
jgi:hypothetical protein